MTTQTERHQRRIEAAVHKMESLRANLRLQLDGWGKISQDDLDAWNRAVDDYDAAIVLWDLADGVLTEWDAKPWNTMEES